MASEGQDTGAPSQAGPKSWDQIASQAARNDSQSPLYNPQVLTKLKVITSAFVRLDGNALSRARRRFQHSLYGKFFCKPPPFEQVKMFLLAKWVEVGEVLISDLPNGFLLIRCGSHDVMQQLLTNGPWSINGIILQLSP